MKFKIKDLPTFIQEINNQTSTLTALQYFVRGCLKLFGCQIAAIWVERSEKYYLLSMCAENSQDEKIFRDLINNNILRYGRENDNLDWWHVQIHENRGIPVEGLLSIIDHKVDFLGFKNILPYPLRHLGKDLGILGLFTYDSSCFNNNITLFMNQLGPQVASLVNEYEMGEVALEREKDLNLLLWGTEILVQVDSEAELLEEAGEMAMVLNLEAGFFYMKGTNGWHIQAPFGRLKQKDSCWQKYIFDQMEINQDNYLSNKQTNIYEIKPSSPGQEPNFPWRKLLIQPVETKSGIIGELWLLDFNDNKMEKRKEVFAAFSRSLGVALETIRQRQKLEQMATTDPLTGILNRQGFSQRFQVEMASTLRHGSSCLLLLLDLDGFKKLNDTHGHPTGDRALCVITSNIKTSIREVDIVARSGGDEFTVVLADIQKGPEAAQIINRLVKRMGLEEFNLGVSIGVAEYPTEADNYEQLYHLADQRLYVGKHSGKNRVVFD